MKILFLVPDYLSLYIPIETEMKRLEHEVVTIFDENLVFDPYKCEKGIMNHIKKYYHIYKCKRHKKYEEYWSAKGRGKLLCEFFDLVFVVNGCSFHNYLLECLRCVNPKIKSVLYIWDSSKYYNYYRNQKYFDKVFTFDLKDSIKYQAEFLPFYWVKNNCARNERAIYKMSIIGSNHDGRFDIVAKVASQFKEFGYGNIFCKLYVQKRPLRMEEQVEYEYLKKTGKDPSLLRDYNFILGEKSSEYIMNEPMSMNDTLEIMHQSEIILDTDRETQTGTTPRVIWALSMGKRIISTNKNLKEMPFYSANNILIIDRENPIIDFEFVNQSIGKIDFSEYISQLRIDKWVLNFIGD